MLQPISTVILIISPKLILLKQLQEFLTEIKKKIPAKMQNKKRKDT